jgi:putative transposase
VEKKELVERDNEAIAVARQCELLGLSRSSYYYSSARDDEYNLELMRQYTKVPFYGVRRLTAWLRAQGYIVNPKRVRVLMRRMGLQAIFPITRRGYLRAWDTTRPTRYILDIQPAKSLLSWVI